MPINSEIEAGTFAAGTENLLSIRPFETASKYFEASP